MMRASAIFLLCVFVSPLVLSSCATILSKSYYSIPITSTPEGATVKIVDRYGQVVYQSQTPAAVELKAAAGYFKRGQYTIIFSKEGYDAQVTPIRAKVDGWYFLTTPASFAGALVVAVVGWSTVSAAVIPPFLLLLANAILGPLVIDPATGKMYSLKHVEKKGVYGALRKSTSLRFGSETDDLVLHIRSMDELPTELHKDLEYVGRLSLRK